MEYPNYKTQRLWISATLIFGVIISLFLHFIPATESFPFSDAMAQSPENQQPKILYNIPYTKPASPKTSRRQSLDLYLPVGTSSKPPLLIFVHGGFWVLSDDEYRIGPSIAEVLSTRNIAVALIRYRLAPDYPHPNQAQDVAAGVAHLIRNADKYGYDKKRIFLSGHSAGGHLSALIALDPSYLEKHRMSPESLAGVITISGIYNLLNKTGVIEDEKKALAHAFKNHPATLKAASPLTHVRAKAPPFLILTASSDTAGFLVDARKFATALRGAGHQNVEQYIMAEEDHFSIVQLTNEGNMIRSLLLAFLKVKPLPPNLAKWTKAKRRWLNPPFSTTPFWNHEKLIRSYPIDRRFVQSLAAMYGPIRSELLAWPLDRYYAIDLFSYLDSIPEQQIGRGDYLILTNLRDEKQVWSRKEIEPYKPVIVVGIDEERNLFRFVVFYSMLQEYSWKSGPKPPAMARPVGAFIHFLKSPPQALQLQVWHSGLTQNSFRLVEENPLAPLSDLPKPVYEAMTHRNGCIYCHSFRGVGSRSHHNLVTTGASSGGFALPLDKYPAEVWRDFMFNQVEVASKMGASPNLVSDNAKQALYDLVIEQRNKKNKLKK